jgi:hypothetical protein
VGWIAARALIAPNIIRPIIAVARITSCSRIEVPSWIPAVSCFGHRPVVLTGCIHDIEKLRIGVQYNKEFNII